MVIQLHIKYNTHYGQTLYVQLIQGAESSSEIKMEYLNDDYWHVLIDTTALKIKESLAYRYILKEGGQEDKSDLCKTRLIPLKKLKAGQLDVFDEWQVEDLYERVFSSNAFDILCNRSKTKDRKGKPKKFTHIFRAFLPFLQDDKVVCICGAGKQLGNWSETDPVLMHRHKNHWSAHVNLAKETFPVAYKFAIYDTRLKKIIQYEEGDNRLLTQPIQKDRIELHQVFPMLHQFKWRGAGLNIQLSSIKTQQSWGVGDFTDLHLLIDWVKEAGMKMIQLLPINDTIAHHNNKDSYPYASISAFALHPMYLNVKKLSVAASLDIPDETLAEVEELNKETTLNYGEVVKLKTAAIRELYYKEKNNFKDDLSYFEFFDLNRNWLVPYAAFCYLRDLNNSPDPLKWEDFQTYHEADVQELVAPGNAHYDEIAIHYFTQYHLHLQLLDAVEYAHKQGIIIKGDLPIGVGRHSAETWMHPKLFHMDMQAGAPPDAFAVKGQNWEFPTYNWEEMAKDDYAWWRQRMEHMSNYFDALRIDHILGFFRIWSIPKKDMEGILGVFVPSLSLPVHDFTQAGIDFNEDRLCQPYINEAVLSMRFPGNETWIKEHILDGYNFKESLNTQAKLFAFFKKHPDKVFLQQGLFDLLAEVILIKDVSGTGYHFRINMQLTDSYRQLPQHVQQALNGIYQRYFFGLQDDLWQDVGNKKLNALQLNSNMLLCAEDLGMVPDFVESVLKRREILSLQVQRMPKKPGEQFSHPRNAIYLSVVTPSTHDMATMRQWWEEEKDNISYFYNSLMGQQGTPPFYGEPWVCANIIQQHFDSPAMWAVFLLQDLLAMDEGLRRENPLEERINIPADSDHTWNYRMHISLEELMARTDFAKNLEARIKQGGR